MFSNLLCHTLSQLKLIKTKQLNQFLIKHNKKFGSSFYSKYKPQKDELSDNTSLHVIGNGSEANACAVCLACDQKLYLFNCFEGLQRLISQYKLKVSKMDNIFLTSNKWHNISGISGLMLNRFDSGANHLNIYGIDCQSILDLITYFDEKFKNCFFYWTDYRLESNKPFIDESVEIQPIIIETNDKNETTIAYICKMRPKSGKLLIEKCFQMKIPRNLLPELQSRQSVVLESGLRIAPEEVHTPDDPEQCFVVLECRTKEFLKQFLKNQQFLRQIQTNKHLIECVVHMTPEDVLNSTDYQQLFEEFSPETKHLVLNEQNPSFGLYSLHRHQKQLHSLDDKVFPNIAEKIETNRQIETLNENKDYKNVYKCRKGLQYLFRPSLAKGLSIESLEILDIKYFGMDALKAHDGTDREGLEECLKQLKAKQELLEMNENSNSLDSSYPEVVFFGTSSAQPFANRNVTSILVNISPNSSIVLDCGEDTFGQLIRYYGSTQMKSFFEKLKAIFVSHLHTDHHSGLIGLIDRHYFYTNRPLVLIIPPIIDEWLTRFSAKMDDISHKYESYLTPDFETHESKAEILHKLELNQLKPIRVKHCLDSFGVRLQTLANDRVIVYSGDAEPSEELIRWGRDCDLLIHEATQDDTLVRMARDQCHSTVSEAIDVGLRMAAKFTLLTHFSARYGKLSLIPENQYSNPRLGIAYDFMRVSLPELSRLPVLLPALNCLYATHLDKVNKRVIRKSSSINI